MSKEMRISILAISGGLALICCILSGCSPSNPVSTSKAPDWPASWAELEGKVVVLEGRASAAKLGPILMGETNSIWIDIESWPTEFRAEEPSRSRLRVRGKVIRKADMPVFLQEPGKQPRAGIPVSTREEFEAAKWRYLLTDVQWWILE